MTTKTAFMGQVLDIIRHHEPPRSPAMVVEELMRLIDTRFGVLESQITENKLTAGEWQPIATAPKDEGSKILVYCKPRALVFNRDGSVEQYTASGVFIAELIEWHGEGVWCKDDVQSEDGYPEPLEPSHWMPLPSAPNTGATA